MKKENVKPLYETKFLNLYDLQYAPDKHYFNASRHQIDNLIALKEDEAFKKMVPDAISCAVILEIDGKEKLLLSYEYRYPTGQFLLSPPAGLIDQDDMKTNDPLISAAIREIKEETGIQVTDKDMIKVVNPCLFSTPGMSDESNGIVVAKIHLDHLQQLSQSGAVGGELFDGFALLSKQEAKEILLSGKDEKDRFYSVYTWIVLAIFVGGLYEL